MDLYNIRKQLNTGKSINDIKLRVTDYARVSTEHLEQKKSLQNQVEHFEQYIKENPNWTYIKGYVDDGITGTSDIKRDNFMKMIEDAKKDKFDLIITKEISRFSRNTLDSIKYTRKLLEYGVAVLFVNDNINTILPDSELRLTIMASMAQDEVRRLSERVKFGMQQAIKRGEILGNNKLYGYKKDKETGNLKIVIEEAKIVKYIYQEYAINKLSLSKICKKLNEKNIKTGFGKKWCISTVSRMIENPKYKGYYCGKKTEILDYMSKKVKYIDKKDWVIYEDKIKIPPIVDNILWEKANLRLTSRKKTLKKTNKNIYQDRYLYSLKILCSKHHSFFHRRIFRKNNQDVTWVCSEYLKNGKKVCDTPNIRESELNYIFVDIFKKLKIDLNIIANFLISSYQKINVNDEIVLNIKNIKKEIDKITLKKDKLLELSLQNILSNEEFKKRNEYFNNVIKEKENKINNLKIKKKKVKNNNLENELTNYIKEKVKSKNNLITSLLLKCIVASKLDDNTIKLDIYLNSFEHKKIILNNLYEFKRGYDTKGAKRYTIKYQVKYILK